MQLKRRRLDPTGICFTELGDNIQNESNSVPSRGRVWGVIVLLNLMIAHCQQASNQNVGTTLMVIFGLLLRSDTPPPPSRRTQQQQTGPKPAKPQPQAPAVHQYASTLSTAEAPLEDPSRPTSAGDPSREVLNSHVRRNVEGDPAGNSDQTPATSAGRDQHAVSTAGVSTERDSRLDLLALELLDAKRRRFLEQSLGSSTKDRPAAAASLLAAMATRGGAVAHQLVLNFNWGLKALPLLAKPPR